MEDMEEKLLLTNQVVKSNKMIESIYSLSAMEQRLILTLCSKISVNDNMFNNFEISVKEFANFMGIENKDFELNRTLKKKCEDLASRTITINTGTKKKPVWLIFNWFHHIQYETGKGMISMQFHEKLEPYLLNLQREYTKYLLGYVMKFKYEHSFRIYELLKEYERFGERTLEVEGLKKMLFGEKANNYQKYSHFKARVINKAIEEINAHSDLKVELIKEEKKARKVVGLVFEIRTNNYKFPMEVIAQREEIRKKTKSEVQKLLRDIILRDYKTDMETDRTDLFDKEALVQLYIEIKEGDYKERPIKNPIPYFIGVLINKHQLMTGEELLKTEIERHYMQKKFEEMDFNFSSETPAIDGKEYLKIEDLDKKEEIEA